MGFWKRLGQSFGVVAPDVAQANVDTGELEGQRQQANEAYQRWLAQSEGQLYTAPQNQAAETSLAGNVQFRDPGMAERYNASLVNAPAPVDVSLRAQSNGVTTQDVGTPEAGAAQAQDTGIDTTQSDQVRNMQLGNIGALQDAAAGRGPSAADSMFANKMGDVTQTQLGLVGQARGNDRAAARREAMLTLGRQGMEAANSAATLKAQEQQAARAQIAGAAGDVRGTDVGVATNQAGLTQGNRQFNAGLQTDASKYLAGLKAQVSAGNADRNLAGQEFTAGQQNQRDITGAQLRLNAAETNAGNQLQAGTTNAQLQTGTNAANAAARNARDEYRSNLQTSVDTGNINRQQGVNDTNAGYKQQTAGQNQQAAIQGEQINQQAKANLRESALTGANQALNATEYATGVQKDVAIANAGASNTAYKDSLDRLQGTVTAGISGASSSGQSKVANSPATGGTGGTGASGGGGAAGGGAAPIAGAQTLVPSAPPPPPPPAAPGIPTSDNAVTVNPLAKANTGAVTSYAPAPSGAAGYNSMMSQYGAPPTPPQSDWERYQSMYKQGAVA